MNLNFFKKQKKFQKEKFTINPSIYWRIMLVLASIIVLASMIFGYILFNKIKKPFDPANNPNIITEFETLNKEKIFEYLDYFKKRENKSLEIILNKKSIPDPSS